MNRIDEVIESVKQRALAAQQKGNKAFPLTFEEVDLLGEADFLVSGEQGGIILSNEEALPLIYRTSVGYVVTGIEPFTFILSPFCTEFLRQEEIFDGINTLAEPGEIEPYEIPEDIRVIDARTTLDKPKFVILNHAQGIIHKAAAKKALPVLNEMNEAAIKHLSDPIKSVNLN